ncbi:MAG: hypothetical protein ACR2HN_12625 [Tepidiformaceae bacterium]
MAVFNGAFPVLPGREDEARAFARDVVGPRRVGYEATQRRGGIMRETWSLQETPVGSFMLVWFEAADIDLAFSDIATASDDYSVWFRGRVKDVTGVDLSEPAEGGPELLVDWSAK